MELKIFSVLGTFVVVADSPLVVVVAAFLGLAGVLVCN